MAELNRDERRVIHSVDLTGQIQPYGRLSFTRVTWWGISPFRLLRYAVDGIEAPLGMRMDMDKKAIFDVPDDCPEAGPPIRADAQQIWAVVVDALNRHRDEAAMDAAADALEAAGRVYAWWSTDIPPWRELDPIGRGEFQACAADIVRAYLARVHEC